LRIEALRHHQQFHTQEDTSMHGTLSRLCQILIFLQCLSGGWSFAQEVDCTVQVNYEAVGASNKEILRTFASDVKDYVNSYKWGGDNLNERIKCTLNIFIQSGSGDNYTAQVFVGSQRKIFGSDKSTAVTRFFDESWEFTYIQNRPISHNLYTFNDLASFLDFYIYIILGYDYDTYDKLSGTPLFQKAADVANLGRSSSQKGWQRTTGNYNRQQLIDEILNPKYEPMRVAQYTYHFAGLDSLSTSPERGFANILSALESVGKLKKEVDPRNVLIKSFFDTKYLEIADLFSNYPDRSIYAKFGVLDPSHQITYEEYRNKKK